MQPVSTCSLKLCTFICEQHPASSNFFSPWRLLSLHLHYHCAGKHRGLFFCLRTLVSCRFLPTPSPNFSASENRLYQDKSLTDRNSTGALFCFLFFNNRGGFHTKLDFCSLPSFPPLFSYHIFATNDGPKSTHSYYWWWRSFHCVCPNNSLKCKQTVTSLLFTQQLHWLLTENYHSPSAMTQGRLCWRIKKQELHRWRSRAVTFLRGFMDTVKPGTVYFYQAVK